MKSPLILLALLLASLTSLFAEAHKVVFLIGEREYGTRDTLPKFAREKLEPNGYECVIVAAPTDDRTDPKVHSFPGLAEALEDADLLVISVRRRMPPTEDLALIRKWVVDGKPVLGVRTSSHAFAGRPKGEGYTKLPDHDEWATFDVDVFGCLYEGHFNNKPSADGFGTLVNVEADAAEHPILKGIDPQAIKGVSCTLYRSRNLSEDTQVLLTGAVPESGETEPVAWTRVSEQGKCFYTSLVSREDMEREWLQQLLANAVGWLVSE